MLILSAFRSPLSNHKRELLILRWILDIPGQLLLTFYMSPL